MYNRIKNDQLYAQLVLLRCSEAPEGREHGDGHLMARAMVLGCFVEMNMVI